MAANSDRVYGCPGCAYTSSTGPDFDHAAEIHDGNAVAEMPDDSEIVADEQIRELAVRGAAAEDSKSEPGSTTPRAETGRRGP